MLGRMDHFPAFIPLAGARIVLVGEGVEADGKARLFDGSPATLVRLAADDAALSPDAYAGASLVFIASEDEAFYLAAAAAARAGGALLVNVVDRPAHCDFYTPAIVDRGAVVAGIGTGGAGPVLAGRLKAQIDTLWPARLGALAELLRTIQPQVRARFPAFAERRAFLVALLDGPAARAALAGETDEALRLALDALGAMPKSPFP